MQEHIAFGEGATFPRDVNGAIRPGPFVLRLQAVYFSADLKVEGNKLEAIARFRIGTFTTGGQVDFGDAGGALRRYAAGSAGELLYCRYGKESAAAEG